jgi:hypothetical protein
MLTPTRLLLLTYSTLLLQTWAIASGAVPAAGAASAAAAAAAAQGTTSRSWEGKEVQTPAGNPDVKLAASVTGDPMLGVPMGDPMADMSDITQLIRMGAPGWEVTAPASAGAGVAP